MGGVGDLLGGLAGEPDGPGEAPLAPAATSRARVVRPRERCAACRARGRPRFLWRGPWTRSRDTLCSDPQRPPLARSRPHISARRAPTPAPHAARVRRSCRPTRSVSSSLLRLGVAGHACAAPAGGGRRGRAAGGEAAGARTCGTGRRRRPRSARSRAPAAARIRHGCCLMRADSVCQSRQKVTGARPPDAQENVGTTWAGRGKHMHLLCKQTAARSPEATCPPPLPPPPPAPPPHTCQPGSIPSMPQTVSG